MAKTRRLQILLEPEQFDRLERVSEETGASIGSLVRDAVDRYYPGQSLTKEAAIERLLSSESVPMDDWEIEKERMIDEMWGAG
ncbi:MAG: hypothetical protein WEB67_00510 [Acidimicrobiia bacterium]